MRYFTILFNFEARYASIAWTGEEYPNYESFNKQAREVASIRDSSKIIIISITELSKEDFDSFYRKETQTENQEDIISLMTVAKIPVIESEAGWGRKIDDYMVCLTKKDAEKFRKEFNSHNTSKTAPGCYMQVEGDPEPIDITNKQYDWLTRQPSKRAWWRTLNKMK